MKKDLAIVLVSGGLDSCVTSAIAESQNYDLAFLHLNYGQRTEKKELECFNDLSEHFKVKAKLVVDVSHLAKIGGSSLTDSAIPVTEANLETTEIPSSYVPFRNANILAIAVSWAEVIGAKKIFIGAVEEDSSGYPDCRENFFQAFNQVIETGTKPETKIQIETPIIHNTKDEIVKIGIELKAPLKKTWSCYSENEIACGKCDSCALRLRGFAKAGEKDPIPYA
ncbi:MAG: 7-cyano-7-deazaguanine synthase QueC [Calditrichaeota bacterium]|nr:MAG: 7-cyano-7-deazaguanine synthase QueC [Calditrichota bacterium]